MANQLRQLPGLTLYGEVVQPPAQLAGLWRLVLSPDGQSHIPVVSEQPILHLSRGDWITVTGVLRSRQFRTSLRSATTRLLRQHRSTRPVIRAVASMIPPDLSTTRVIVEVLATHIQIEEKVHA